MTTEQGKNEVVAGPVSRADFEIWARDVVGLQKRVFELENTRYQTLATELLGLAERITALEDVTRLFSWTPEDIDLIKQHVRHPGALEAAKLKERIRAAVALLNTGHDSYVRCQAALSVLSAP